MYRWCSFCQTFLGQSEPHHDYNLTHSICKKCKKDRKSLNEIAPVVNFFNSLREEILQGNIPSTEVLYEKASALKIEPMDLLVGFIQPMLYQIGKLYEKGAISVAQEHLFSSNVQALIYKYESEISKTRGDSSATEVLLICAEGNYHDIGVKCLNLWLHSLGFSSQAVTPSLPLASALDFLQKYRPLVLGVSVSDPKQLGYLQALKQEMKRLKLETKLAIGGLILNSPESMAIEADFVFTTMNREEFLAFLNQTCRVQKKAA